MWDIYKGTCIINHRNESDNHEIKAIYDMAISPDGTLLCFGDNHGHISILGLDSNQKAKSLPHEQFFSTDYRYFISFCYYILIFFKAFMHG